jgi:hypothetical protein
MACLPINGGAHRLLQQLTDLLLGKIWPPLVNLKKRLELLGVIKSAEIFWSRL